MATLYRIRPCGHRIRLVRSVTSESKPAAITVPNHFSVPSAPLMRPRSTVSTDAVDDDVGGGLGILCRNTEFARMVVAGARRDDGQRNVGLREHLQRERDDAVTADDHQRVHPALECAVDESSGMLGVGSRDRDDVDAASMQLRDRPFGRMRRAAVPRRGVGQHRDSRLIGHGISLPGLRIPAGSSVALTACSTSTPTSPTSSRIHGR